ncbi:hypothetical protein LTS16_026437 [Friedmanniomyces endolithicus]|nr:hypothetical protein LTR94_023648 [Friedmanniomyces endolithicus]KAK0769123.1 hypothetical protein LTR38_017966 [Friedmanniomyces endolithicus]KAK0890374.1 hypothetical protein LTR57_025137 [Friedmanniomyces endolithicus]KAK1021538.1 hypothetical protein LTS16_026437 [Friedmanniomyces endolithicus]
MLSEPDQRPLARLQNAGNQPTFSTYLARFLCYSLRVLKSCGDDAGTEEENETNEEGEDSNAISSSDDSVNDKGYDSEPVVGIFKDAHRLHPCHGLQKERLQRFRQSIERGLEDKAQSKALLEWYGFVSFQKVREDMSKSALLRFLAVPGINEETFRLRQTNDFSYMLVGVVYSTRVLAIEVVLPSDAREEQDDEDDKRFRQVRDEYLADGTYSVIGKVLSLLAYGKSIALSHKNAGSV